MLTTLRRHLMSDKITVVTDLVERQDLQKNLILYVIGIRDILFIEPLFKELVTQDLTKISDINYVGKMHAFIICYARIFHKNHALGQIDYNKISGKLNTTQKNIHKYFMEIRNKYYAHNDAVGNDVMVYYDKSNSKITALSTIGYRYLTDDKKEVVSQLLEQYKNHFEEERDKILIKLYSIDNAYQVNEDKFYTIGYYAGMYENAGVNPE